jgi:hypothetical protein
VHRNCHARSNPGKFANQDSTLRIRPRPRIKGSKIPSHKWKKPSHFARVNCPTKFVDEPESFPELEMERIYRDLDHITDSVIGIFI